MSDTLSAQLLKLGLVSPEAVERRHEKPQAGRADRPQTGRREEGQPGRRDEGQAGRRRADGAAGPARAAHAGARPGQPPSEDDRSAAQALVSAEARVASGEGSRRFYFETRDGRVPYLAVAEDDHRALSEGALAIVEAEGGEHRLLPGEAAARLVTLWPDLVRAWRR